MDIQEQFEKWWQSQVGDSSEWTSLERLAAKDAYKAGQESEREGKEPLLDHHMQMHEDYTKALATIEAMKCCGCCNLFVWMRFVYIIVMTSG